MRLYSMYFICKSNYEIVDSIIISDRIDSGNKIYYYNGWFSIVKILNKLVNIPAIKEAAVELYESVPVFLRDRNQFDFDSRSLSDFLTAKKNLLSRMKAIIDLYENADKDSKEYTTGFDILLPQFNSIKDLSDCMKDLEFIVNQCPYLRLKDAEIKYRSVDVGSFWITFFIAGSAAATILLNLSKLVDSAVKIKSHIITVKMQEEVLRSMELKNSVGAETLDAFRKVNKALVDKTVNELEAELEPLNDGEERDKVGKSLERLAEWMSKGMQIYSAIDAPEDVKDLFPQQEERALLNDDVIKLLEMKKKAENSPAS